MRLKMQRLLCGHEGDALAELTSAPAIRNLAGARPVRPDDAPALAALMLDSYRGTVDDGGEGPDEALAEVGKLLSGGYGMFNFNCSELVERDGRVIAATLVTEYESEPLIAFSMTHPDWQRRGLARAGLVRAMRALKDECRIHVNLAVTDTNTPARRLYESLGFVVVPTRSA
jgi:GNAT superfamily N-acetyltransferase